MANLGINLQGNDNLTGTLKNARKALDDLKYSATELGKASNEFDKITNSGKNLKTQLRQLTVLLGEMEFKGLSGSEEFTRIAEYAGQVKDAMGDASQAISKYSSDTSNLDAMSSAFQGLSGTITLATGAMNLFGVENEEVQQAILKVQSAMALLNGVQAIANTLNKDSALMLKLKSMALFSSTAAETANTTVLVANTTAETANTTAGTANTTAEVANTAAEVANTAAKGANTASTTANSVAQAANTASTTAMTAATGAATASQLALNAAVLANPYVLAAAAVAALVAGIVIWVATMEDATDKEIALTQAVEEFSDACDTNMKQVAEQILLYNKLKAQYDSSGKKVDEFSKKIINNTDTQKKLGVTVKTVDDVHRLFANNTNAYQSACLARASAMAAEAAQATLLGKTIAALSSAYAKLMAGEEVNYQEFLDIAKDAGIAEKQARQMLNRAGIGEKFEYFGKNDAVAKDGADLAKLFQEITQNGASKVLGEMAESFHKTFQSITEDYDFGKIFAQNEAAAEKVSNGVKKVGTTAKQTHQETKKDLTETEEKVKKILTSFEGCDAIIQEAEKEMKKLDSTSSKYASEMKRLKQIIQGARASKLLLIDNSTMRGITETRKIIQEILNDLEPETKEFEEWNEKLKIANEAAYDLAQKLSVNGDMKSLKGVLSAINVIIESLPEGSEELEQWIKLWAEINGKIVDSTRKIDNLKKGIEEGSIAALQQQIKDIDEQLTNKKLTVEARVNLSEQKRDLQAQINEMTKGQLSIPLWIESEYIETGSLDDALTSLENARTMLNRLQKIYEEGFINKDQFWQVARMMEEDVIKLLGKPIEIHIEADWEKFTEQAQNAMSNLQNVISTVDAFDSLAQSIEDGANAWEVFKNAVTAVNAVLETYSMIMGIIQTIKEAHEMASLREAAAVGAEATAEGAATTAEGVKSGADTAATATAEAATAALKSQEAAYLDLAAAAIFAAHASIPFAGVGIATGLIAQMMAAQAAQHAAAIATAAFADGGIVGGGSPYGDKLLVRVNSGEMILNGKQQKRLFDILDGGGAIGGNSVAEVQWKIKGADLYGSLKNYSNIKSKSSNIKRL